MAAEAATGSELVQVVALLTAGVVAVPIFKRLGLGSILGYLAAGLVIGPFGLRFFSEPEAILHVAELGVVMFLFIIGLEMQPSRLWGLRREIFGLGALQVGICALLLTFVGRIGGFPWSVSFVAGAGFVLTSTAIVMQVLEERGDRVIANRQRVMSVLLLEDLAIVPLLALIAFLSPGPAETGAERWLSIAAGLAGVIALIAVSRWLLNPMFRILAASGAREIMTAAALLVVLGAALAMQWSGLSMAMGAFAAGVMLSESSFRHQLEADIEPFRGLLLGLFFMGVGMSLDVNLVLHEWRALIVGVLVFVALKMLVVYGVGRLAGETNREAAARAALMSQGGEFAFVLYSAATQGGVLSSGLNAALTAAVIMSMALTPLIVLAARGLLQRRGAPVNMEGVEEADGLDGDVLMIGFGRFGQIASQALMAQNISVSIIETDTDLIRSAAKFGFKVYYGDGARLDVLHASGADKASADADRLAQVITNLDRPKPQVLIKVVFMEVSYRNSLDVGIEGGAALTRRLNHRRSTFPAAVRNGPDHRPVEGAQAARTLAMEGHHGSGRGGGRRFGDRLRKAGTRPQCRHQRACRKRERDGRVHAFHDSLLRKVFAIPGVRMTSERAKARG